jgi:hypothetical protein
MYWQLIFTPNTSAVVLKVFDLVDCIGRLLVGMSTVPRTLAVRVSTEVRCQGRAANGLLEGLDGAPGDVHADAQGLDANLGGLLERADGSDVRVCAGPGAELAGTGSGPGALCVAAWPRVAAGAGGEDGSLARGNGGGGCVENEGEAGHFLLGERKW